MEVKNLKHHERKTVLTFQAFFINIPKINHQLHKLLFLTIMEEKV